MEALLSPVAGPRQLRWSETSKPGSNLISRDTPCHRIRFIRRNRQVKLYAVDGLATDPSRAEVTWQIVVGAIAGVTPFVVAGIEFSKRIIAQRRCEVCGGSGLVFEEKEYFRCPGCGGFLPWQSWKRFFSG